jgi:ketosteroid isomerase-like protein
MSRASATRPPLIRNEDIRAEIRKSLTQSASAFSRGDVETILGSYAPDAVVLPPNSPAVQGIVAIRQLWESLLAGGYRNAEFELQGIEHWGDVALAIGRYKVRIPNKSGATEEDRGKYVGHWRRMPDGHFRVTVSMWYSDRWHQPGHP